MFDIYKKRNEQLLKELDQSINRLNQLEFKYLIKDTQRLVRDAKRQCNEIRKDMEKTLSRYEEALELLNKLRGENDE